MLRSGIGPADELAAIGVKPVLDLPGVGRNLYDQPCVEVHYEGSGELIEQMQRHQAETGWRQAIERFIDHAAVHYYQVSVGPGPD